MIIGMFKETNIAKAPDELCKAINDLTPHTAFVTNNISLLQKVDIIHWHNTYKKINHSKQIIQYHSEPERVMLNAPFKQIVIAQYHATLPEYKNFSKVRNIVNFNTSYYNRSVYPDKIRIGYSPSKTKKINKWYDKGYPQTKKVLDALQIEFPQIEVDIITGVTLEESILRKSRCSIIIDECVTTSYHRSALEGLALGKMTICSISEEIQDIVKNIAGERLPVENITIDNLYDFLKDIIHKPEYILSKGQENRKWMETFWSPKK